MAAPTLVRCYAPFAAIVMAVVSGTRSTNARIDDLGAGLNDRIDDMSERVDRLETRLDGIEGRLRAVALGLGKVVQRLATLERVLFPAPAR